MNTRSLEEQIHVLEMRLISLETAVRILAAALPSNCPEIPATPVPPPQKRDPYPTHPHPWFSVTDIWCRADEE